MVLRVILARRRSLRVESVDVSVGTELTLWPGTGKAAVAAWTRASLPTP
jgi:hypothetical protein